MFFAIFPIHPLKLFLHGTPYVIVCSQTFQLPYSNVEVIAEHQRSHVQVCGFGTSVFSNVNLTYPRLTCSYCTLTYIFG